MLADAVVDTHLPAELIPGCKYYGAPLTHTNGYPLVFANELVRLEGQKRISAIFQRYAVSTEGLPKLTILELGTG